MPKPDERFNVTISLNITSSDGTAFFDIDINYSDMKIEGVLAVESVMVDVLRKLSSLGFAEAGDEGAKMKRLLDSLS